MSWNSLNEGSLCPGREISRLFVSQTHFLKDPFVRDRDDRFSRSFSFFLKLSFEGPGQEIFTIFFLKLTFWRTRLSGTRDFSDLFSQNHFLKEPFVRNERFLAIFFSQFTFWRNPLSGTRGFTIIFSLPRGPGDQNPLWWTRGYFKKWVLRIKGRQNLLWRTKGSFNKWVWPKRRKKRSSKSSVTDRGVLQKVSLSKKDHQNLLWRASGLSKSWPSLANRSQIPPCFQLLFKYHFAFREVGQLVLYWKYFQKVFL